VKLADNRPALNPFVRSIYLRAAFLIPYSLLIATKARKHQITLKLMIQKSVFVLFCVLGFLWHFYRI
jgi:hypothetical protein